MTVLPSFPFTPGPASEPPPEYDRYRAQNELPWVTLSSGRPARVVTRYADVRAVLSDKRFSRGAYTGTLFARENDSLPLVTTDGELHQRRRGSVAAAFTTRRVRQMRPWITELAEQRLDKLAGPVADLVRDFTVPYTMLVVCRILGVPDEDTALFRQWVDPMMSISGFTAEQVADGHRALHAYFQRLVDERKAQIERGEPAPGLITGMLSPASGECRLSPKETVVLAAAMMVAGYETTSNELGAVLHLLLRHPEWVAEIRADDGRAAPIIEEIIRYVCGNGTGGVPHVALADTPLPSGAVIREGEVVVPVPDAANRDPAVFEQPRCMNPDRGSNQHVVFGFGPHYCLGAELARLEMRIAVQRFVRRFPNATLTVPDDELKWRHTMFVRGLWGLPVALDG
jgi:cytochrome P450